MKTILLFSCIVLAPFSALAQTFPIQQRGSACPLNYYSSAGYCVPSYNNTKKWSVPTNDKVSCPLNTYREGNYCTKSYGSSY